MDTKDSPLAYFRNMYLLALADGKIAAEETSLLEEVAKRMGVSNEEIESIQTEAPYLDFFVPENNKERLAHLEYIIRMMMIDGEIHQLEYNLCLTYAYKSGCDQLVLDMLIEKVAQEGDPASQEIDQ